MIDQFHSAAISISKHYPISSLPALIQKLQSKNPKLAEKLQQELPYILPVTLSREHFQQLQDKLPTFLDPDTQKISLRDCYLFPHIAPEVLHFLELRYLQQEGQEEGFRNIELSLSRVPAWAALRDFYLRFLHHSSRPSSLHQEARQKALVIATQVAPHPTHALQLVLDWVTSPHAPHQTQIHRLIQQFHHFGWHEHLGQILEAISNKELVLSHAEQYQQASVRLRHQIQKQMFLQPKQASSPEDQERQAATQADFYEARRLLLQAAQKYQSSPEKQDLAVRCWCTFLSENPADPNSWQLLYEALIPTNSWDLLGAVLSNLPQEAPPLPRSYWLRYPLLEALFAHKLESTHCLLYFLQALLETPEDSALFQATVELLVERKQWKSLRQVYHLHLTSLKNPLQFKDVMQQLLELYQGFSLPEHTIVEGLMALAFSPQDRKILAHLVIGSQKIQPEHPLHQILYLMASEGFGSQAFQLLCPPPPSNLHNATKHERILNQSPQNVEALHRVRQQALEQRDFEKALKLYQHELEMQHSPPARAFLLRSIAELYRFYLNRQEEALHNYRQAQQLTPQDPDLLLSLAELYEALEEHRFLIPTLGKLLHQLPPAQKHPQLLRKIAQTALHHLGDYSTAMQALSDLLLYHPPLHHSLDLIRAIANQKGARPSLLKLLREREKESPEQEAPWLWLEICRTLFLQDLRAEAKDWLQRIFESNSTSKEVLQKANQLAAQYRAWPELLASLQRQVRQLHETSTPRANLSDLYTQIGDLQRYNNDLRASFASYQRALLYNPKNPFAFERIRAYLYEKGADVELHAMLQRQAPHIENNHTAAAAYTQLALLEHHLYRSEDAILSLQQAKHLDHGSQRIRRLMKAWQDLLVHER